AVCVEPCFDILCALLAILKAGGVYLPLDPTHPPALLMTMLEEAKPRLILTQSRLGGLFGQTPCARFCFDADWDRVPARALVAADPSPDQPSHLLYTSGTTGKPKGALATQGNLAHYVDVARRRYGFGPGDVFCSLARYTFSISLFELLLPLCAGATVR